MNVSLELIIVQFGRGFLERKILRGGEYFEVKKILAAY